MNKLIGKIKKYESFLQGIGWREYFHFTLFNVIISNFIGYLGEVTNSFGYPEAVITLGAIYILIISVLSVILSVWRLRYSGCGWWLFKAFIKLLGAIGLVILMMLLFLSTYMILGILYADK